MKTVPDMLREGAATYEERNKTYGDNYKKFGHAFAPLLAGITLNTPADFNRMGILTQMLSKISRYAENFSSGGHDDSLLDLAVYTTMLRELDNEARGQLVLDLQPPVAVPVGPVGSANLPVGAAPSAQPEA